MINLEFNTNPPIISSPNNPGIPAPAKKKNGAVEHAVPAPLPHSIEQAHAPQPDAGDLNAYWAAFDNEFREAFLSGTPTWYLAFQPRLPALLAAYKRDPSKGETSLSRLFEARVSAHGGDLFASKRAKGGGPAYENARVWCAAVEEFLDFEKTDLSRTSFSLFTYYQRGIYLQTATLDLGKRAASGSPRDIERQKKQREELLALQEKWYRRLKESPSDELEACKHELLYSIRRCRGLSGLSPGEVVEVYECIDTFLGWRAPHSSTKALAECLEMLHQLLTTYPQVEPERGFAIYSNAIDEIDNHTVSLLTIRSIKFAGLMDAAAKLENPEYYLYGLSRLLYSATKMGRRNPQATVSSLTPLYQAVCATTMKILAGQQKALSAEPIEPAKKKNLHETERVLLSLINEMLQTSLSLFSRNPQADTKSSNEGLCKLLHDSYRSNFSSVRLSRSGGGKEKARENTFFTYLQQTSEDEKVNLLRFTILPYLYQESNAPAVEQLMQSPLYKKVMTIPGLTLPYLSKVLIHSCKKPLKVLGERLDTKPNAQLQALQKIIESQDTVAVKKERYNRILDNIPDVETAELEKRISPFLTSPCLELDHRPLVEIIAPLTKALIRRNSFTLCENLYWLITESNPYTRDEFETVAHVVFIIRLLENRVNNLTPLLTSAVQRGQQNHMQRPVALALINKQRPEEREWGSRAYANAVTTLVESATLKDEKGNLALKPWESITNLLLSFPNETLWNAALRRYLSDVPTKGNLLHLHGLVTNCIQNLDKPPFDSPANKGLFHRLLGSYIQEAINPLKSLDEYDEDLTSYLVDCFTDSLSPQEIRESGIEDVITTLIAKGLDEEQLISKALVNGAVPAYVLALEPEFPKLAKAISKLCPEAYTYLTNLLDGRENIDTVQAEQKQWIESQRALFQIEGEAPTPALSQPEQAYAAASLAAHREAHAAFEQAVQQYLAKAGGATTEKLQEHFSALKEASQKIVAERNRSVKLAAEQRDKARQTVASNKLALEEIKLVWQAANNAFKADCSQHRRRIDMRKGAIDAEESQALEAFAKVMEEAAAAAESSEPLDAKKIKRKFETLRQQAEGRVNQAVAGVFDQDGGSKRDLEGKVDRLRAAKKRQKEQLREAHLEIERLKKLLLASQENVKKETPEGEWYRNATQPELIRGLEERIARLKGMHGDKAVLLTSWEGKAVTPARIDKKFRAYAGNPTKAALIALYEGCGITQTNQEGSHRKYQFVLGNGHVLMDGTDTVAAHGDELCPRAIIEGLRMTAAVVEHFMTLEGVSCRQG